jgi:hypothetical protein
LKMSSAGTSRSEAPGVKVCALSALCAFCVEVCALCPNATRVALVSELRTGKRAP